MTMQIAVVNFDGTRKLKVTVREDATEEVTVLPPAGGMLLYVWKGKTVALEEIE